jgi:chemotaxis protein histidine kinase CheA
MEELCREFLIEATSKLKNLQSELQVTSSLSEEQKREIFRSLHTLKGNSQAFNLNVSGKLAHELENLLQAERDEQISPESFKTLFHPGINLLLETFQTALNKKPVSFPHDFAAKIHQLIPNSALNTSDNVSEDLSELVAPDLLKQFSQQEKESLAAALALGDLLYLIEVGFDFADFDEKFKELRNILIEHGAVIANFPSAKFAAEGKIGFQIFFVSRTDKNKIAETIKPLGVNLEPQNALKFFSRDLKGILARAVSTGQKTAVKLGKQIEFEVSADEIEIPAKQLSILSEALLHLVRNAIDHGIENRGKIYIKAVMLENHVLLRLNDNGRGIDVEQIRTKAIAKNLIQPEENISRTELMKLIFTHGFSTSDKVSEISGRGVGLDAVQTAIKKIGGEIQVESETGNGSTFEISLPIKT